MSMLEKNTKYFEIGVNYTSGDVIYVPDAVTYLVEAIGGNADIEISMNTKAEIDAAAATVAWYTLSTVTNGTFEFKAYEYGFNAMRVVSANDAKIWIKG